MGRAHEVRAASMAKTAAAKSKLNNKWSRIIYMAAKSGVPDPDLNQNLKKEIEKAKREQVTADVIKRAIEKAKGGTDENYTEARYEGFGPGNSTIIVDCLTDNTNRAITDVKTCFNKCHGAKLANSGAVSYNYESVGLFVFAYEDEDAMLEAMMEAEVDVQDISVEDGEMTVKTTFQDFGKAQDAIEKVIPGVEFDVCEATLLPTEFVTLDTQEDKEAFDKLLSMLNDCDDVNKIYTNVKGE